jgi:hypothetical protein
VGLPLVRTRRRLGPLRTGAGFRILVPAIDVIKVIFYEIDDIKGIFSNFS